MKYALIASATVIIGLLVVVLCLLAHLVHGNMSCTYRTTFNPVTAIEIEAINDMPEGSADPLPLLGVTSGKVSKKKALQ